MAENSDGTIVFENITFNKYENIEDSEFDFKKSEINQIQNVPEEPNYHLLDQLLENKTDNTFHPSNQVHGNKNVYGNVKRPNCDDASDRRQGLIAIIIVILFIFATFSVYMNTRRKRRISRDKKRIQQIFEQNSSLLSIHSIEKTNTCG